MLMTKEKRYNTLNNFYRDKFRQKVFKVSLNAFRSCPHMASGGCVFCLEGSGEFAGDRYDSLEKQFITVRDKMHIKWPNAKYIVYFQAYSNTYGNDDLLISMYEQALSINKDIVGISISTRPDCISDNLIDYFEKLSKKTYLTIELGLQSAHDKTLKYINRGHSYSEFASMVQKLRSRNINVVVHIINGLPYETKNMMTDTIKKINSLDVQGIKIHLLHIMKGTKLADLYLEEKFETLTQEKYTDIVCDQLEILNKEIIVHRLTGDAPKEKLIEPMWSLKKFVVINEIDKEMRRRDSYQGCLE